jgi:galactofuranosylgalactofuranosylrhamnosyl-N-acetylglucosaminyl-diphospho-decaprenol beta-1,5/1,6-galactofuranosyltransferase
LLLAPEAGCESLCWRHIGRAGEPLPVGDAATIGPGDLLQLDTFLNSFYERYWRELTGLATLALDLVTSGPCRIRIVRRVAGQEGTVLTERSVQGRHHRTNIGISLASLSSDDAVIHAEVEALDETAAVHEGAWLTDDPPRNDVRLAIVICSYGREEMLVGNLRRMAPIVARSREIGELLIVRQGKRDLPSFEPYATLMATSEIAGKLRLVEQDNFGGSGGFARGMLESLERNATDILLLDDDIRIEPAILDRLTALLAYLKVPTTLGGQMLDLHRPTTLYASHERVKFETLELYNPCKGIDLAITRPADLFGRIHYSDYNAWWFCSIPASTCRAIGLPLPMFVRHDDVEYGVRTAASSAALVTMPGLFVWHEPFAGKLRPIYVYYERRNFLIAATLHTSVHPRRWVSRHRREAWEALRVGRYEYCWALCRAVDDYLEGPDSVFSGIVERHRRLSAKQVRLILLTMTNHKLRSRDTNAPNERARKGLGFLRWQDPARAKIAKVVWHLRWTIVRTSIALMWRGHRVGSAYRTSAVACGSPSHWRCLLGLSAASP